MKSARAALAASVYILLGATATAVLSSCAGADLEVTRLEDVAPLKPQTGQMIYYLPMTTVNTAVTVTLNECSVANDTSGHKYALDIDETLSPVIATEADPSYRYAISYEAARTWKKEIKFTLETAPNGVFKSLNSSINDQSGAIAVAALTAAVKIAASAIIPGTGAVGAGLSGHISRHPKSQPKPVQAKPAPQLCTDAIVKALNDVKDAKKALDDVRKKPIGKDYTQAQQDAALVAAQNKITSLQKKGGLQRTIEYRWVPNVNKLSEVIAPSGFIMLWLKSDALDYIRNNAKRAEDASILDEIGKTFTLQIDIDTYTTGEPPAEPSSGDTGSGGLVLRQPATGWLRVCKSTCTPQQDDALDVTDDLVARQAISLPQMGQVRLFPEHSALFENANLVISTNADGSIASAAFNDSSTAATGISGLGSAADAVSSGQAARNTAITSANTAAAAQASYADTVNKNLAQCATDAAAAVKAGYTPRQCQ